MFIFNCCTFLIVRSLATDNNVLYRLDISQSHVAIGNVLLSNLMSLMTSHYERWALMGISHVNLCLGQSCRSHRLRQLIIDGVEPVFGDACYYDNSLVSNLNNGQKEAIQKVFVPYGGNFGGC